MRKRLLAFAVSICLGLSGIVFGGTIQVQAEGHENVEHSEENAGQATSVSVNATEVDLYVLDEDYQEYLSIPDTYAQNYQLKVNGTASKPQYSVYSGDSVTVSEDGLIEPAVTIWYRNGNYWTTVSTGAENETISVEYNFGTSVIQVKVDNAYYYVTVTVNDYAEVYAEQVIDDYIADNITDNMSDLDKLKVITAFPAQYDYSAYYSGYIGMIICGGGDCWASSSAILHLCEKVGLQAHLRYGANDGGAGSGHRNVAVKIGSDIYIAEAGFAESAPRYYSVTNAGAGYDYNIDRNGNATIVQYDGFDTDLVVPASIDGHPVTAIGEKAFYYGERYSGVILTSISLPDTITEIKDSAFNSCEKITSITIPANVRSIGDFVFTNCESLKTIEVDKNNQYYSSVDGVLFDKGRDTLLYYPASKSGEYTVPDGVSKIGDYSFYYTNQVTTVYLPESITDIGEGAFGTSSIDTIYFYGDLPVIEPYAFHSLDLCAYYPVKNTTWSGVKDGEIYNAYSLEWKVIEKGNLNGDESINIVDLMMCLHHVSGRTLLTGNALAVADINDDGTVNIVDLMRMLHYVSGRNSKL